MVTKELALEYAREFLEEHKSHIKKAEIVGSIRRNKPMVNDVDILVIPNNINTFGAAVHRNAGRVIKLGSKMMTIEYGPVKIDLYIADEKNWATLLLIRTGSKENNISLCRLAKMNGMTLHADGRGLSRVEIGGGETLLNLTTEEDIYNALGIKYQPPEKR